MTYKIWRERFSELLDPKYYTLDWLDGQIRSGAILFWCVEDAAILTELRTYPTGLREVHGLLAVGNLQTVVDTLIPLAEEWGKRAGCAGAVIESREGWVRALKNHGWSVYQTSVRKGF